ncbi:MAG: peptidylprolyl isomerase [Hasllibacter sp.]
MHPIRTAAAVIALALPAAAENHVSIDTVVATVGGTEITIGQLLAARDALPEQFRQLPDDQLFPGLLDKVTQQAALARAAGELPATVELRADGARREVVAAYALNERLADRVTDDEVRAAYDEQVAGFEAPTEYNAAHILVETEEEAREIVAELDGGAEFGELAMARSTGPSGPRGGDLGWFQAGQMVEPFQDAVAALEPGAISAPVQTQFGWHVIRLNETREVAPPPFEEVAPQIRQSLQREAVGEVIEEVTAEVGVELSVPEGVDPSVLSTLSLD